MSWEKFIAAFDVHGDMQHGPSVEAFFKFAAIWKPKHRIMGGDLWDFRPLRAGANEDERRESLRSDLNAGKDFFNRLKPQVLILGNHDDRLWKLAANGTGVARDYAQEGVSEINRMISVHKSLILPYEKSVVYRLGDLNIFHGMIAGSGAARRNALIYRSCLFGHTHSDDQASVEGLDSPVGYGAGCLCVLKMGYNAKHVATLRQANGFAYGVVNTKSGKTHVWKAKEIDGQWLIPSDVVKL